MQNIQESGLELEYLDHPGIDIQSKFFSSFHTFPL